MSIIACSLSRRIASRLDDQHLRAEGALDPDALGAELAIGGRVGPQRE